MLKELKETADKQGIVIHSEIREDFPRVLGNATRLKEVFVNLLSNAIKYNKKGGEVWISTERKGDRAIIHITDNGIGITPEDQKHIFGKFWRAKEVQETKGTGLGLFIVKQLVELMSGKIWFTSTPGEGSTFSFSLRCAKKEGES